MSHSKFLAAEETRAKRSVKRTIWYMVVLVLGLLVLFSGWGLAQNLYLPAVQAEEYVAYAYDQEAVLDYRVHLQPNDFFGEEVQGPDQAYMSDLTDHIAVDLHYAFAGEEQAGITGEYSASAYLTARARGEGEPGAEQEEGMVVWQKDYQLLSPEPFASDTGTIDLEDSVRVPYAEYRGFVERLREDTGFSPDELQLIVEFDVLTRVETEHGVAEERLQPRLVVPMRHDTFTVEGDRVENHSGGIMQQREVAVDGVHQARTGLGLATVVFAGLLGAFLFTTVPVRNVSGAEAPRDLALGRLLKKHRERIVRMVGELPAEPGTMLEVESFDDLLKVADELQKPVVYQERATPAGHQAVFLVLDDTLNYRYVLPGEED